MTGPPPLLQVEHVTIRRQREAVLDDVSLSVAQGGLHVIVGPNGAGKSTLVSAVLGLTPFEGRILLNWTGAGRIGYVPQSFPIDSTLPVTVEDFLALTRQRRPVCLGLSSGTRQTVSALLTRVGLLGLERRPLSALSGGELRRVLLAHALDPEPELLVLDEPSSGLDEASSRWLEDLLAAMRDEGRITVLMVSHDRAQVRRLASTVTILDRRVVAQGAAIGLLEATDTTDALPDWASRRDAR